MSAALVRADALRIPLADESVDLIITSPPYFALRSYRDGDEHYDGQIGSETTPQAFLEALWAVTAECWRVLKPTGSLWVNLGDKYAGSGGHNNAGVTGGPSKLKSPGYVDRLHAQAKATRRNAPDRYTQNSDGIRAKSLLGLPWRYAIGCIDGLAAPDGQRWILRAEVVWSKPNGLPESVTDRVRRSHEQWFHMVKNPRYFAAVDEVREPHAEPQRPSALSWEDQKANGAPMRWGEQAAQMGAANFAQSTLGKLPGSVWTVPSEPLIIPEAVQRHYDLPDHFAAFPQEFPRRIILGWSPNGVCVECGEGRRPVVAKDRVQMRRGDDAIRGPQDRTATPINGDAGFNQHAETTATITGYACACSKEVTTCATSRIIAPGADTTTSTPTPSDSAQYVNGLPALPAPTRPAVILDPFCGTGTVPMVARALGRFGIGIDLSADYLRLARWRITSGHAAKAVQRTHKANQGDLFATVPKWWPENVDVKGEVL